VTAATTRPTTVVVDLDAIRTNVATLRATVAPALLCVVVKADGYGHGAVEVAQAATAAGAACFAVAVVEEGVVLRRSGIDAPILVLAEVPTAGLAAALADDLSLTVGTREAITAAGDVARDLGVVARLHLKVDTGMHRLGASPDDVVPLAQMIVDEPSLHLDAVWTHLAVADEPERPDTKEQEERFARVEARLADAGIDVPMVHLANSAGSIAHPTVRRDLTRCGVAVYGLAPSPELDGRVPLVPAMSVTSEVAAVRRVEAGEGVSYGHRFVTTRPTTIVTVPIGYADGVPRRLGAVGGEVLIGGRRRPIAGTITMDQLMVDCGDDDVVIGDEVVLIGRQGDERIDAWDWARLVDTIGYEIVCGFGPRLPRRYVSSATSAQGSTSMYTSSS
jgi:alanine racemase